MASTRRGDSIHLTRKASTVGKKSVAEPSSIAKFVLLFFMHVCKKILLVDPTVKLGVYFLGVAIGSFITDVFAFPRSYFSDKSNFLNVWFVKWGWGWTFVILFIFIYHTSYIYCCGEMPRVKKHLWRLAVGTGWWFICTRFFDVIEHATGFCTSDDVQHSSKKLCLKDGYIWMGFDISGHVFLMIHCLLTISEEVRCIKDWSRIGDIIKTEEGEDALHRMTDKQLAKLKEAYNEKATIIKVLLVMLTLLQMVWEVMLVTTVIYFHNMPQKVVACGFAAVCWFVSYRIWFFMDDISPGLPGRGPVRYQKD